MQHQEHSSIVVRRTHSVQTPFSLSCCWVHKIAQDRDPSWIGGAVDNVFFCVCGGGGYDPWLVVSSLLGNRRAHHTPQRLSPPSQARQRSRKAIEDQVSATRVLSVRTQLSPGAARRSKIQPSAWTCSLAGAPIPPACRLPPKIYFLVYIVCIAPYATRIPLALF